LTTSALVEGIHTISLTVTDDEGVPCLEPATQKLSVGTEHIFVCDGFAGGDIGRRWPEFESTLQSLGAVENSSGTWVYERSNPDITYFVHECHSPEEMREALTWPEAHVMFSGHSNYGLGAVFSTPQEWGKQRIEDIRYADDDRVLVVGSDMYATDYAGMKYGQAYPNWELINKDGTSAIMPYDFSEGTPPYNYYLTYTIPGDPIHYPLERPNGSWYDRFNGDGARTPIWYSPEGLKPDPDLNPEYFITNPGPFNHSEFVGEWPNDEGWIDDRVSGSVYQYHEAGTGANTATYTFVVEYPGDYDVKASWLGKWYNASNTPFTIQHADGVTTVLANQRKSVGNVEFAWNYLGTFRFEAGVYTVQISDNANDRVVADSISLQSPGQLDYYVQPEFRADVTQGDAPLTVTFDNLSYTSVSGDDMYRWTFGDGSISTEPDPVHTYSSPGIYTVSLRVTDPEAHVKTMTKEGFIVAGIAAPLRAEFATSRRRGPLPRNVSFTDQSSGEVTAWHWDFGDGSTSDEQNPSHAYETVGLFDVSLTVTGPDGENTHTEIEYVYTYASITVDDQMRHKPHFGRKVVLDTRGPHKIPEEELQYSRLFYLSCFSGKYFISTFHQGKMFYTKNNWRQGHMGPFYIKMYLTGSSDLEILDFMNGKEDIYEFYDFNLKPPSMR
jgi:PKD repeat protein